MKSSVLLLAVLVGVAVCGTWTIVDSNYATIAMACSFQDAASGWVGGGSASLQPLLLHTDDAGANFTNAGLSDAKNGAFLAIDVTADGQNGVAGALGMFGLPCGAFMNDGQTWSKTHEGHEIVCAAQDAQAIDSNNMVIVGEWVELSDFNGNGVQISTDGGKQWLSRNWNQGTSARYGSFQNINYGFVTGGQWPEDQSKQSRMSIPYRYSQYLSTDGHSWSLNEASSSISSASSASSQANPGDGYVGIIALGTSEGKNWQTMVNITNGGIYFNGISCVDQNNCWACAEGVNSTSGAPAAYVYHTSDGWHTYDIQLTVPGGSLVAVSMLNQTFGWVGGAQAPSAAQMQIDGGFWETTDGGQSWTLQGEIHNFYPMDISLVDSGNAYSSGVTSLGLSSLARYSS